MPYGYNGKILHVNLTTGELTVEEPQEKFYRRYMGGSALGLYYLLKEMPASADPLGPDNVLVLALSVITGAPISGQSRLTAAAKSPLTGAVGDSQAGGFFPAELKFAGFDAVIIKGRAPRPVYLWIHDGQAELRDAGHLWGRITGEVEASIREELRDERIEVLQCGPAGEKEVRFAALINMCNRANGRTGMGAVMGAKNLKAVAVRGRQRPSLADKEALSELARWGVEALPESGLAGLAKFGTSNGVPIHHQAGRFPTRNFTSGVFEGWKALAGQTMYDTILRGAAEGKQDRLGRDTCYACVVRCKRVVEVTEGPYRVDPHYGGPEYESVAALGSYCGVSDLAAVVKANELCNKYGMDTISCGGTIAWAMECFENGLLTLEDTGGIELRFGNAAAMVQMVEMIGRREGFGDILAEGSARAAARIGRGTERFLTTSKKQEAPAHMPQVKPTLALIYAVNPFGADHMSHAHDAAYADAPEGMAQLSLLDPQPPLTLNAEMVRYAMLTQHFHSLMDSVNVCQFVFGPGGWQLYGPDELIQTIRAVTGWKVSLYELMKVGERRLNMMRAFNAREGIGREADTLPEKFFYRGFIFDLDGTLYRGEQVIPGAPETIRRLREQGSQVVFISNKPLQQRTTYAAKLTRLGIPAEPDDVITSAVVLGRWLAQEAPGARLYVVGEPPLVEELRAFGLHPTDGSGPVDFVVAAFDRTFDYAKLNTAFQAIRRGARFVATNADRTCPVEDGEIPDAAAVIGALEGCTGKRPELVAGKPSPMMIEAGLARMGLQAGECLVVGDRLETDIRMGKEAGTATALVLTGVTRRKDLTSSPWQPDYVLESVAELTEHVMRDP